MNLLATIVANIIKLFRGVIYATSGVFPYGFDWGYADSDVITIKKVFITLATVAMKFRHYDSTCNALT